ncbi:protein FAM178B isoform X3 [Podarcis raffonei]|uniref:protein FAM178B isoform X3 n=1 Tax=Podarcis raffonei TaxID=65483 RepID=UPI0023293F5D|nr:protein FAM178B isoform X3 [Podarcis raffonei]
MKKTGKQSPGGSSSSSDPQGTSRDASEQMSPNPPSQEDAVRVTSFPHPKQPSYSMELFNPWQDLRWYQIPLSSSRRPKAGLFSFTFQSSLEEYQQLRKSKNLKIGRPFSMPPLSSVPLMLTDGSQEAPHKRQDGRRRSRAGEAKGGKSLSYIKEPQAALRQMQKRSQKCRSSAARFLSKRDTGFLGAPSQGQKKGPGSSCSNKEGQQGLSLYQHGLPNLFPPAHPLEEASHSSHSSSLWGNPDSPLEEDQEDAMFPPDWSPPRIEFLYNDELPPLSPAPDPASEYQSLEEMPDITQEPAELHMMESTAKASSPAGDHPQFLEEPVILQPKNATLQEAERVGPVLPMASAFHMASEQLEGAPLEGQTQTSTQRALELESPFLPSPSHPLATPPATYLRSSASTSSSELAGDPVRLPYDSDQEEDPGPEHSSFPTPAHFPMTSSSISASPDELSGDPRRLALGSDMDEDTGELVSLGDLLQMSNSDPGSEDLYTLLSPEPDGYLSSLDKFLEKRFLLEQFLVSQATIPAVHPGEGIFVLPPYLRTALTLDTVRLKPQNQLERYFFGAPFALQMALLQDGFLGALYHGTCPCPQPLLQWLFQLMSWSPVVSPAAFQTLWETSAPQIASAADKIPDLWCPMLKDITQAFYNLGACTSALYLPGLVQPEFRPKEVKVSEDLPGSADTESESLPEGASWQLTLTSVLGDLFKFLTLCVASHPRSYPDRQRLALLVLLCRLGLDKNLRKHPQTGLQQLLLVLFEGIQDWSEKLPELCRSLCHVSQHHHNLVAVVRSFPDTTARGRQLRRNLSLCFITKLLGKMQTAVSNELQQLVHLLPLMKPALLKQGLQQDQRLQVQPGKNQQEALAELDLEACYLCHSLLTLANVVVGTTAVPLRDQRHLQQLCIQLQQHITSSIREDAGLMYRTELKDLAAQTFLKWEELHSRGWLKITSLQGQNENI